MDTFTTPGKTRVVIYNPIDAVDVLAEGSGTTTVELIASADRTATRSSSETTVTCTEVERRLDRHDHAAQPAVVLRRRSERRRAGRRPRGRATSSSRRRDRERTILSLARGGGDDPAPRHRRATSTSPSRAPMSPPRTVHGLAHRSRPRAATSTAGTVSGAVKVRTVSGDVVDRRARRRRLDHRSSQATSSIATAPRHVDVTSVSGDVTVDRRPRRRVGQVHLRRRDRPAGVVRHDPRRDGERRRAVGIPPGRGVSVDARSMSGDLSSEIDLGDERRRRPAAATSCAITAHSVSGDVEILRARHRVGRERPPGTVQPSGGGDLLARSGTAGSGSGPGPAPRSSRTARRPAWT